MLSSIAFFLYPSRAAAQQKEHQEHRHRDPESPQQYPSELALLALRTATRAPGVQHHTEMKFHGITPNARSSMTG
jgi:hypothetical protein